ncbi:MAG TPA: response regulator [Anaerolineales bacterium]|nr:response regulator [Anaerolineales bacterium]
MPKVVLVDDDKNLLTLLDTFLELEGFEVVRIGDTVDLNGAEVYSAIQQESPDLVLMDVYLNQVDGMDGFDLLRRLRRDPKTSGMRILMSSGMDVKDKCKQEGADGFIMKPFMPDELLLKIKQTLAC